jgi:hypothetical protein
MFLKMAWELSEMLDKSSGEIVVSELALEMRRSICTVAGTRGWQENRKSWLAKAARKIGISPRQAQSLFYNEGNPRAELVERVRAAVRKRQVERTREARNELAELNARIARVEALLRVSDPDFHQPEIDAAREMAGRTNRTVD